MSGSKSKSSTTSQILPLSASNAVANRLLAYTRPQRNGWYLAIVSVLVSTLFSSLALRLIAPLLDAPQGDLNYIATILIAMAGLTITGTLLMRSARAMMAKLGQTMMVEIRADYHDSLMRHGLAFYREYEVGELTSVGMNDAEVVGVFFTQQVPFLLVNVGQFILALVFMFNLDWQLTLISIAVVGLLNWLSTTFVVPSMQKLGYSYRKQLATVNGKLSENLTGVRDIQIFTQEDRATDEFRIRLNNLGDYMVRNMSLTATFVAVFYLISGLGPVLIFGAGAVGFLKAGLVVSFYTFFAQFVSPLTAFSNALVSIQGALVSAGRIFRIMDIAPTIQEKPDAVEAGRLKGHIKFENVTFSYQPNDPESWQVQNINLEILPGEKVAFVGGSGSGKSTLINLVARFYDSTKGRITIDGYDVRQLDLKSLRQNFGMVAQNAMLFHGTLADNIRFGDPNAPMDKVKEFAEIGNVSEFIDKLENGYETELGEMGQGLSGGQKQRVAIARAALINPSIYIFDEATSALDTQTEYTVTRALDRVSRGCTTLVIAHRLNTIINADKIVLLGTDDKGHGVMKAVGSHEELLKTSEEYALLYGMKARNKIILMPISPVFNTLPLLPTVIGLARAHNAPVFLLDLGTLVKSDTNEQRFGIDLSVLDLDELRLAELNNAHTQRVSGISNIMQKESVKCEVIRPEKPGGWIDQLIYAVDKTDASHLVVMEHFLIPFEQIQMAMRTISRKTEVEIILVDPTVGVQDIYDFGKPKPAPEPIDTTTVTPTRKPVTNIAAIILPVVWLALVLLLGYPIMINVGLQSFAALLIAVVVGGAGYLAGMWWMQRK